MGIDFKETERKNDASKLVVVQTKGRAMHLEGQVLPQLINKLGDVKSGRISRPMVEAYLDRHTLIFDREVLMQLFNEADHRREGSLDARSLGAALSGRYPKRGHGLEWRKLVALLLGLPQLVLHEDIVDVKRYGGEGGTYNSDSVWTDPPPALPPITRRPTKPKTPTGTGDFAALSSMSPGSLTGDSPLRTTQGPKTLVHGGIPEGLVNTGMDGEFPISTFAGLKEFQNFSRGQELGPGLMGPPGGRGGGCFRPPSPLLHPAASSPTPTGTGRPLTWHTLAPPPQPHSAPTAVRSWAATLPPSATNLPSSALHTLRGAVRSTMASKPDFRLRHPSLTTAECDMKKTLGQACDTELILARVEPVRGTKVLYNASYTQWSDYASNCPTAPSRWYNDHPSAGGPQETSKYPW
ncbi:MAG: hypothetical protein WDW36_003882 [Sanguina aurantia]